MVVLGVVGCGAASSIALACNILSSSDLASLDREGTLHTLDNGSIADAGADSWIDCVGILHVIELRGVQVANAQRFGEDAAALRTTARLADLSPSDLRAFCDWEACIRTNGYAHACALNDAGWESCHVCSGPADCDGRPMNEGECVAHATDPGRAECHVGLLQECLLQQALRGPGYSCATRTCRLSEQACAGQPSGDPSAQALAAQRETDQVTIEEFKDEIALEAKIDPDSGYVTYWERQLSLWDGGSSSCGNGDRPDGATLDSGEAGD
jgi:hypothetical protein